MTYHTHWTGEILDLDLGDPATRPPGEGIFWNPDTGRYESDTRMNWVTPYTPGDLRYKDDVVLDEGWLMIANKETTDPAGPDTVGDPFFIYSGTMSETSNLASQIIFGNRYIFEGDGYLSGYRVYTISGNEYTVYSVADPLGAPKLNQLISFIADSTGWRTFAIPPQFLISGATFDLVAQVNEPAATPVIETYSFNYETPQNPAAPAAGEIQHSRGQPDLMDVSYTDNIGGDITAFLQGLRVGDKIQGAGSTWSIQSSQNQGAYITFVVSPALVGAPTGVQDFDFQTVTPTPIVYAHDVDYWAASPYNAQGLLGIDTPYPDITPNNTAYGTDIYVQSAIISQDWDFLAYTDSIGGGSSGSNLTAREVDWVQESAQLIKRNYVTTVGSPWVELGRTEMELNSAAALTYVLEGKRTDAWGVYYREARVVVENDGGSIIVNPTEIVVQSPNPQIKSRHIIDGSDIVVEVKGRLTEEWSWKSTVLYNEISE